MIYWASLMSAISSSPPLPSAESALFLDVDGTLLELARRPQDVVLPTSALQLLELLYERFGGAIALVSGRSIQTLDQIFAPLQLPAAGLHGLERRDAAGNLHRPDVSPAALSAALTTLTAFAQAHPGIVVEDKGITVALHYREAPECEAEALKLATRVVRQLGRQFELQPGKMVVEIRPTGTNKGDVIAAYLKEPPFAGRTPAFAGDDITDEAGFAVVNARGGVSIRVGCAGRTEATYCVPDVRALYEWLAEVRAMDP